jgi:ubiquinone/menaquinone biosynthesis C-methylase UbiE
MCAGRAMNIHLSFRPGRTAITASLLAILGFAASAQSPGPSVETSRLFASLELIPGQTVGEIGAGKGELTLEAARTVGGQGKVLTSELGDDRVKQLQSVVQSSGLLEISVITGDPNKTNFPENCCDAIFMRNVYHHFADPAAMNASILQSLKPGGHVAVVDFQPNRGRAEAARAADRARDESHGVSPTTVARELREAGLEIVRTEPGADRWFMVVAMKPRAR